MRYAAFSERNTPRLHLRKMCREDVVCYYTRLASSEQVTRSMLFRPHQSVEESERSVEKHLSRYEAGPYYHWVITLRGARELIGVITLLGFDEAGESASFAYMLGEEFWGRGYGTEALGAVLDFAFGQLGLACVQADHFVENPASGAVMRKAGMERSGFIPGKYEKNGIRHDAVCYRMTREMWEKHRSEE